MSQSASDGPDLFLRALEGVGHGSHLCLIYETRDEQLAALLPFMRLGLERGERCIYIADDGTGATVLDAMRAQGLDAATNFGALSIATTRDTYLDQGPFDPDAMIRFLGEATEAARGAGFSALRVTGEMTWALGGDPGVERLIEYEAKLNDFFPKHAALAICQYNRERFSPEVIREVIRTHPWVVFGGAVCRNFSYIPPDELRSPVGDRAGRVYGAEEIALAETFAGQAAVALENARLYQEAERRTREAELIAGLAREISSSLDLGTVLQRVTDGARDLCRSDIAEIALWDPDAQTMVFGYWAGIGSARDPAIRVEPGKGLGGQAILTRRPLRTDDYAADPRITKDYLALAVEDGLIAQLVVPIFAGDLVDGLLYVGRRAAHPFTDEDEAILVRLADQAAVAIQNARLYAESERRRKTAENLAEVARHVSQSLDPDAVAQRIADSLLTLIGAQSTALYRADPESGNLLAVAMSGAAVQTFGRSLVLPRDTGVSGLAVRERRPVWTADVFADARIAIPPEIRARVEEIPYRAILSVPLLVHDRVVGALAVADMPGRVYDDEHIRLVQAFADQAAMALENARLFDEQVRLLKETRRQHVEALALELVARQITSSLERDEVLQRIVDRARALCGCDLAFLAPYDAETDTATIIAAAGARSRALFWVAIARGRGIGGTVLETGEPFVTENYLEDPRISRDYAEAAIEEGTVAQAVVPLRLRDAITGLLCVVNRTPRHFTSRDLAVLAKLADQAAIALENSRLYAERTRAEVELRVRAQREAAIAELGKRALTGVDLTSLLDDAMRLVAQTLDVDFCHVLELLPSGDALLLRAGTGWQDGCVGRVTVPVGTEFQAGYTLFTDDPVIVEDLGTETRFGAPALLRDHGVVSGLTVVIRGQSRSVGVIGAFTAQRRTFEHDDVHFLQSVANVLAAATERNRAEEALRRSEESIRELYEVIAAPHLDSSRKSRELLALGCRCFGLEIGIVCRISGDRYEVVEALGPDDVIRPGTVFALAETFCSETVGRGDLVAVAHAGASADWRARPCYIATGLEAYLGVPIRVGNVVHGTLNFSSRTPRRMPFQNPEKELLRLMAQWVGSEISRHHTEVALRESEERFRGAFEQSLIGRALQALDGRYLRVNQAFCDILGYAEPELLATTWRAVTHPDDLVAENEHDRRILAGEAYQHEKRYVHKRGHGVWARMSVTLIRDAAGQPLHFLSEIQDITSQKRADEALRQHVERLRIQHEIDRAIVAARSPEAIAQAALKRIRRLIPCQRASVTLFDFEAEEVVALAVDAAVPTSLPAGARYPLNQFHDAEGLRSGAVRVTENLLTISPATPVNEILKAEGLRSALVVPLMSQNTLIGALNLLADVPSAFGAEQVAIAMGVADSLAVAIQDARLFEQVRAGRERLQALTRRLVETQEAERRHLARELHDEIGQVLTGLKLTLEIAAAGRGSGGEPGRDEARKLVDDLIARVRELSLDLRPAMLDHLGLLPAFAWQFERYAAQTGLRVEFQHAGLDRRFPPDVETAAYRIVQEALTNAARHAGVGEVTARAWTDGESLTVQVEDQGRGFDVATAHVSSGLTGMRERAVLLGGDATIESAPGAGTRVTARLPLVTAVEPLEGAP